MFPVREADRGEDQYREYLALIRERILGFALRRLVPRDADFADAEEIAQSSIVVLWERYPDKRELGEMMAIAIGTARKKIAQFRRDRGRDSRVNAENSSDISGEDLFEHIAARETMDRFLRALLQLSPRCRELLRLKLIEQQEYAEIRMRLGIAGNIYEMTKRCHQALLRVAGGSGR
jgi:RNA polymerase sigma factor (sigma-70 family)